MYRHYNGQRIVPYPEFDHEKTYRIRNYRVYRRSRVARYSYYQGSVFLFVIFFCQFSSLPFSFSEIPGWINEDLNYLQWICSKFSHFVFFPYSQGQPADMNEKIDSVQLEYLHMLTSQLESQRKYYEEKLSRLQDESKLSVSWNDLFFRFLFFLSLLTSR